MEGFFNDTVPACVVARIGDYDFNKKYTYKEFPNINIEVFINVLREGVLLKEINGRPLKGNTTIIEAIGVLHEKAHTFFKTHFADKIVTFEACDFRLDPKTDRSGRVAVCEDKRLSLQHVGQDVPALMLDVKECEPLQVDELLDILVTLSSFYNTSVEKPTRAQKPVFRMLEAEVPARREEIARNMDTCRSAWAKCKCEYAFGAEPQTTTGKARGRGEADAVRCTQSTLALPLNGQSSGGG